MTAMHVSRIYLALLMVTLLAGGAHGARAQQTDARYFSETGHWVSGDFLALYDAAVEPVLVYGYPISEAFVDARSGLRVQYFQRARFELHPEAAEGEVVRFTPIGSLLYTPGQNPALDISNALACRTYGETAFPVCYAFLDFFEANGGAAQFGYPISGFETYGGRIVQYFERARFEWYPELGEGRKVRLADLGRTYFDSIPEDAALLAPTINNFAPQDRVQKLLTHIFVGQAVTRQTDDQQVYVIVQDQTLQPVAGAAVELRVVWPDGTTETATLTTDKNGLATARLGFDDQPAGRLVILNAESAYQELTSRSSASFRIWY
jgi:hypothetical protein